MNGGVETLAGGDSELRTKTRTNGSDLVCRTEVVRVAQEEE